MTLTLVRLHYDLCCLCLGWFSGIFSGMRVMIMNTCVRSLLARGTMESMFMCVRFVAIFSSDCGHRQLLGYSGYFSPIRQLARVPGALRVSARTAVRDEALRGAVVWHVREVRRHWKPYAPGGVSCAEGRCCGCAPCQASGLCLGTPCHGCGCGDAMPDWNGALLTR